MREDTRRGPGARDDDGGGRARLGRLARLGPLAGAAYLLTGLALVVVLARHSALEGIGGGIAWAALLFAFLLPRPPASTAARRKEHFPGLNGIRFIAAFLVVVHHVEQAKERHGWPNLCHDPIFGAAVTRAGGLGVSFFFVLSGFLITYLLLAERADTGRVSVKDFYIRRALRIWPVFYLLTLAAFFLYPYARILDVPGVPPRIEADLWSKFGLFFLLTPQLASLVNPGPWCASVLWTTGVEEHFYFVWPWLVRFVKRGLTPILLALIPLSAALKQLPRLAFWAHPQITLPTFRGLQMAAQYFIWFRIEPLGGENSLCRFKDQFFGQMIFIFHKD
jgi:peptidoglycan/LPS O-acetylase OafA/YrhL